MDRIEKLKQFLLESPGDSFLQHALALEYIKLGDDETAKNLFEEILARDPKYVGTYYHLAKLCERNGAIPSATMWYEKGMAQANAAGEQKTYSELRSAYEELTF